jgi:uncharacterized membrane protein
MSMAHALPAAMRRSGSRWLLLGSLALNLFFVGATVALSIRTPSQPQWNRDIFVRVEQIAAALPVSDAQILREGIAARHDAIDAAQARYHDAREEIRETLRQSPFKVEAMRGAMADTRAARQTFDQVIQSVFADAAGNMSAQGRLVLANWRSNQKSKGSVSNRK